MQGLRHGHQVSTAGWQTSAVCISFLVLDVRPVSSMFELLSTAILCHHVFKVLCKSTNQSSIIIEPPSQKTSSQAATCITTW
jgi:hypothetical protein